jgi:hypothetical protein
MFSIFDQNRTKSKALILTIPHFCQSASREAVDLFPLCCIAQAQKKLQHFLHFSRSIRAATAHKEQKTFSAWNMSKFCRLNVIIVNRWHYRIRDCFQNHPSKLLQKFFQQKLFRCRFWRFQTK